MAYADTCLDATLYIHASDWYEKRERQRNFLRDQDRETRRCAFLYDSDADTMQEGMSMMVTIDILTAFGGILT